MMDEQVLHQLKPYYQNYRRIDNALKKEKELRDKIRSKKLSFNDSEMKKLNKKRLIVVLLWAIAIALLTTILYFVFSCDTIVVPLIISTIIASLIAMYYISSVTEDCITKINKYVHDEEIIAEREIVKMYSELLTNVDIYQFLAIPSDIKFDKDDLPYKNNPIPDLPMPYGDFTRYIAPSSGSRYHRTRGCSGAHTPVHMYSLSLNEYRLSVRYYTPCGICGLRDTIVVPEWYVYYRKVRDITKKFGITSIYSIK